ncbi:MAG: MarR family EPS-associated transcriptional regulator [Leptospiraceae bacterium]|nr:MarR family EPS-associated transcriptional regulator [Leptospiraceae bacterium]
MAVDIRHKVLSALSQSPNYSQRELSEKLGVSLGKVNYCIQALVNKGILKVNNFKNNKNKKVYAYILTPRGVEEKLKLTIEFLKVKVKEYETIKQEIEELKTELGNPELIDLEINTKEQKSIA